MNSKSSESTPVASPCRRECCLDDADVCLGCGRSLAEIREWGQAGDLRRREICALALLRQAPRRRPG